MIVKNLKENLNPRSLLSNPSDTENLQITRQDVSYKNISDKYILTDDRKAAHQYCSMYSARLNKMRPLLEKAAKAKWGIEVKKLCDLSDDSVGQCAVVGTIFKQQNLKPSILREISEDIDLLPQPVLAKYVGVDDHAVLEDELQRIVLTGDFDVDRTVTGIVCCVKGEEGENGKFVVEDVVYAGVPTPLEYQIVEKDAFLLFVSGLNLYQSTNLLAAELLVDYITGQLGQQGEQEGMANIVRVIMAGNFISASTSKDISLSDRTKAFYDLDVMLAQVASVCPVDVMPGEHDPANCSMPQQPLHKCMFPNAGSYSTFNNVPNPYESVIGGRVVVGTAGQNIENIMRCSSIDAPLEALEKVCQWGHLAPTAPDTLISYPFIDAEPFVIDSRPDIMFAGNQNTFASKIIKPDKRGGRSVLLLSIPQFGTAGFTVLVNLKNLDCQVMQFGTDESS